MSVSQAGYYWGNYSYTYLEAVRKPSAEATQKHIKELREILDKSEKEGLKPPPGLNAELAYWLMKSEEGNTEEAAIFFSREVDAYPESKIFVDRLTN